MASNQSFNPSIREWTETDTLVEEEHLYSLPVWNDEVNISDWIIETLIEVWGTHRNRQNNAPS